MRPAHRLERIPPYLFAELEARRDALVARGVDVIDLGIGDPDLPTPPHVVEALADAARDPATHRYPAYAGAPEFRQAVAEWFAERFGVALDPGREVLALIGSKEGIAHAVWAFVDPGDVVLVPDPAYPVYRVQTLLAGGTPHVLPLRPERGFLPDLAAIPDEVARRAKLLWLNYPNNPTGATVNLGFFEEVVAFARRHQILVCHDAAYVDVTYGDYVAPSILQVPGARECCLEFHSLSKPFNMTGWRVGFAVGGAPFVQALGKLKTQLDSGVFTAVQRAAVAALRRTPEDFHRSMRATYTARRDLVVDTLRTLGLPVQPPRGGLYVWAPVPEGTTSGEFAARVLERAAVVVSPGAAFGEHGEGFFRISLTVADGRLREAMDRLRRHLGGEDAA